MATALQKFNKQVDALAKKHPNKKRKTLQRELSKKWKSGNKGASKPKKKRKAVTGKRKYKVTHKVKKVGAVKHKRKRASRKKAAAPKVRVVRRTVTKYRSVGKRSSGTNTALIIGGLAVAGVAAYLLLKPKAVPNMPPLVTTGNTTRDSAAQNLLAYAQAANLGVTAITALINSINNWSDSSVISASSQVATGNTHIADIAPPTGGPSITLSSFNY